LRDNADMAMIEFVFNELYNGGKKKKAKKAVVVEKLKKR
jgi:hypothetical protein